MVNTFETYDEPSPKERKAELMERFSGLHPSDIQGYSIDVVIGANEVAYDAAMKAKEKFISDHALGKVRHISEVGYIMCEEFLRVRKLELEKAA